MRQGVLSDFSVRPRKRRNSLFLAHLMNPYQFSPFFVGGSVGMSATEPITETLVPATPLPPQETSSRTRSRIFPEAPTTPFKADMSKAWFDTKHPNLADVGIPDQTKQFLDFASLDPERFLYHTRHTRFGGMVYINNNLETVQERALEMTKRNPDEFNEIIAAIRQYNEIISEED